MALVEVDRFQKKYSSFTKRLIRLWFYGFSVGSATCHVGGYTGDRVVFLIKNHQTTKLPTFKTSLKSFPNLRITQEWSPESCLSFYYRNLKSMIESVEKYKTEDPNLFRISISRRKDDECTITITDYPSKKELVTSEFKKWRSKNS